jgi:hypothetical protein
LDAKIRNQRISKGFSTGRHAGRDRDRERYRHVRELVGQVQPSNLSPARANSVAASPALQYRVDITLQLGHPVGDESGAYHRRLTQASVFDNFTLYALAFTLQQMPHAPKLVEQPVNLLERATRNLLKQRIDTGRLDLALTFRLSLAHGRHLLALADVPFRFRTLYGVRLYWLYAFDEIHRYFSTAKYRCRQT